MIIHILELASHPGATPPFAGNPGAFADSRELSRSKRLTLDTWNKIGKAAIGHTTRE